MLIWTCENNKNTTTSCSAIFHRIDAILVLLEPARKDLSNDVSHLRVDGRLPRIRILGLSDASVNPQEYFSSSVPELTGGLKRRVWTVATIRKQPHPARL
jgi:hypothetical protein